MNIIKSLFNFKEPVKLNFAEEFTPYPFGKNEEDGEYNGVAFRKILAQKFEQAQKDDTRLDVVLDGVHGLGGSFLNEAFGELARELKESKGIILSKKNLSVYGKSPHYEIYINKIWECINKHYDEPKTKRRFAI